MKRLIVFLFFLPGWIFASFTIEAPKTVDERSIFEIKVILDNDNREIHINGRNFDFLGQSGISISKTLLQGRFSEKRIYTYQIKSRNPGIISLIIEVGGEREQLEISVVKSDDQKNPSASMDPPFLSPNLHQSQDTVLIRNHLSKKKLLINETAYMETILYSKLTIESFQILKNYNQRCYQLVQIDNVSPKRKSTIIEGKKYRSSVILRYIIYAPKQGTCTIERIPFRLNVRLPGYFTSKKVLEVESPSVVFQVVDHPRKGRPDNYTFQYGDYRLGLHLSTEKPEQNTPIRLSLTISGTGNFLTLNEPVIQGLSPTLSLSKDKVIDDFQSSGYTFSGNKTYHYYLTPEKVGALDTPWIVFPYYSPTTKRYVTLKKKIPRLEVVPYSGYESRKDTPLTASKSKEIDKHLYPLFTQELPQPLWESTEIAVGYHLLGILALSMLWVRIKKPLATEFPMGKTPNSKPLLKKISGDKSDLPWPELKNLTTFWIQKIYSLNPEKSLDKEIKRLLSSKNHSGDTDPLSEKENKEIELLQKLHLKINYWDTMTYHAEKKEPKESEFQQEAEETVEWLNTLLSLNNTENDKKNLVKKIFRRKQQPHSDYPYNT